MGQVRSSVFGFGNAARASHAMLGIRPGAVECQMQKVHPGSARAEAPGPIHVERQQQERRPLRKCISLRLVFFHFAFSVSAGAGALGITHTCAIIRYSLV